eukprot:10791144-Ditylum_brightwellii.AAC.4
MGAATTNPQDDNSSAPKYAPECYRKYPTPALSMDEYPHLPKKQEISCDDSQSMSTFMLSVQKNKMTSMEAKLTFQIEVIQRSMSAQMTQPNSNMAKLSTNLQV